MILQIDGWLGGGKGVLQGLLDGHPDIAPNPVHDATHLIALFDDAKSICESKDIDALRRLVSRTQYYVFEKHAHEGIGSVAFGAGIVLKPKFNFDFYEFDKSWVAEVLALRIWTPEIIVDIIYQKFSLYLTGQEFWNYHLSMSWPLINLQQNFIERLPKSKTIFVERSITEIIAVRSGRKKRDNTIDLSFAPNFDDLIKDGEIIKIQMYISFIDKMINSYPESYMKVPFNALLFDREVSMNKIANFLNIPFHDSMLKWTFLGEEVMHNGKSYVDGINDKPEDILSKHQLYLIEKHLLMGNKKTRTFSYFIRKISSLFYLLAKKLDKPLTK